MLIDMYTKVCLTVIALSLAVFGAIIDPTGRFSDGYLLTGAVVGVGVLIFVIVFREKKHHYNKRGLS